MKLHHIRLLNFAYAASICFSITACFIATRNVIKANLFGALSAQYEILARIKILLNVGIIEAATLLVLLLLSISLLAYYGNLKKYFALPLGLGLALISLVFREAPPYFRLIEIFYFIVIATWILVLIQTWLQSQQIKGSWYAMILTIFSIPVVVFYLTSTLYDQHLKNAEQEGEKIIQQRYNKKFFDELSNDQMIDWQNSEQFKTVNIKYERYVNFIGFIPFIIMCLSLAYVAWIHNPLIATGFIIMSQFLITLSYGLGGYYSGFAMAFWILFLLLIELSIICYGIYRWNSTSITK